MKLHSGAAQQTASICNMQSLHQVKRISQTFIISVIKSFMFRLSLTTQPLQRRHPLSPGWFPWHPRVTVQICNAYPARLVKFLIPFPASIFSVALAQFCFAAFTAFCLLFYGLC